MKTINLIKKLVYGIERLYPNCEYSKIFAELLGRKTLTTADIISIKLLGYTIECGKVEQL